MTVAQSPGLIAPSFLNESDAQPTLARLGEVLVGTAKLSARDLDRAKQELHDALRRLGLGVRSWWIH